MQEQSEAATAIKANVRTNEDIQREYSQAALDLGVLTYANSQLAEQMSSNEIRIEKLQNHQRLAPKELR